MSSAFRSVEKCVFVQGTVRDYLKSLKKESMKEETMTDLEFTSNFITKINSPLKDIVEMQNGKRIENIKEDPDSHSGESCERDVDYVQVIDNNLGIYECRTCSKVFYTLEDQKCHERIHTDSIEESCMKMDFDEDIAFSDQSEGDGGNDLIVAQHTIKSEIDVLGSNDQEKIGDIKEDPLQMLMKTKIEEEMYRLTADVEAKEEDANVDNGNGYESDASTHPKYLPTKPTPPKIKRGRGRPRKHPASFKSTGRPRGRPPLPKLKVKSPKSEIVNFPCPQCEEVFTKISLLEKHTEQHDGLRIYECDACNKKFRRRFCLKQHMLSHVDVKAFVCMVCGKCFKRRDNWQKHLKLHSDTEVHRCDLCRAVFNRPENLAKHKFSKHNLDEKNMGGKWGKENFLCSECEKVFVGKDDLIKHIKRHREEKRFECKFCGKRFSRWANLTEHVRYHTGGKKHLCVICGRGFGKAYNLNVHMRTHTGERFQCELCPKTFMMGHLLKQHKRVAHGLNIVGNEIRLKPINKLNPPDDTQLIIDTDPLQLQQIEVSERQEEKSDMI